MFSAVTSASGVSLFVMWRMSDGRISDQCMACGFRRYSVTSVLNIKCVENGFQFESEILIKLLKGNATIGHITIPAMYGDEVSSIHNITDTYKFIKLILGNLWQKH